MLMFYNNVMLFQDGDGLKCCFCSQIYYEEKFAKRFQGKFCYFQMAWISFSPIWSTMKVILQFILFFHVRAIWSDIVFFQIHFLSILHLSFFRPNSFISGENKLGCCQRTCNDNSSVFSSYSTFCFLFRGM